MIFIFLKLICLTSQVQPFGLEKIEPLVSTASPYLLYFQVSVSPAPRGSRASDIQSVTCVVWQ